MAVVGLVVHEDRAAAVEQANVLAGRLEDEGHVVRRSGDDGFGAGGSGDLDLVVSLGGDGSILRAVGLLDGRPVPVLGVNFGHLGYLTAVEPEDAVDAVARTLAGDHGIEERMMLRVEVERADGTPGAVDYVTQRGRGGAYSRQPDRPSGCVAGRSTSSPRMRLTGWSWRHPPARLRMRSRRGGPSWMPFTVPSRSRRCRRTCSLTGPWC